MRRTLRDRRLAVGPPQPDGRITATEGIVDADSGDPCAVERSAPGTSKECFRAEMLAGQNAKGIDLLVRVAPRRYNRLVMLCEKTTFGRS